ncbi:hypothetical protein FO519_009488 [Halicephalobus sp. NKZ332]|nr:hypothetical protein FO519_009488 [Halicephalobus sp. NKZ332]
MCKAVVLFFITSLFSPGNAWFYGRPDPGLMSQGGIWPLPWNLTYFNDIVLPINPDTFAWNSNHNGCEIIDEALKRYKKLAFSGHVSGEGVMLSGNITEVSSVVVSSATGCTDAYPQHGMDESYSIQAVPGSSQATIQANSVWGVLRGLESFSQLIYQDFNGIWWLKAAIVDDHPRFPYRGIMFDTARHYLSVSMIKRQIDIMSQNKFNVFHWHISDDESFPYVSVKYPELSRQGAYSPKHVYTTDNIKDIINFARLRGVRVIPEFDTPGHTGSWKGVTGLLPQCYDDDGTTALPQLFDTTKDSNYDFLKNFFAELLDLFQDNWFHFGGDEVQFFQEQCWINNKDIARWMEDRGMGNDTDELLNYYWSNFVPLIQNHKNVTMVFWEEVLDRNIAPQGSIAHVWKGDTPDEIMSEMYNVTEAGHKAILSSCWYLNYIKYGAEWGYVNETHTMDRGMYYECDPTAFGGTQEQIDLVIGGEAAMWAEMVDGSNLTPRMWPRASAVAERLWSDPAQTVSADDAWPRLHEYRCRLLDRGYPAEPPNFPDYCPHYWDPDYFDVQVSAAVSVSHMSLKLIDLTGNSLCQVFGVLIAMLFII